MPSASFYRVSGFAENQARRTHRIVVSLIIALAAVTSVAAYFIFGEIENLMTRHSTAASDNRTWVFSQLEVDLVKLTSELAEAELAPASDDSLETVRSQFDILYSRVALIRNNPQLLAGPLEQSPEWQSLLGNEGLLERWVPAIDGPASELRAALPQMRQDFVSVRPGIRQGVVDAVFSVMGQGDVMRSQLRDTLRMFATITFLLLTGMMVLLGWLFLQSRSRMAHARILELALQNLRMTISSSLDAVMIVNARGLVVGANTAAVDLLGEGIEADLPVISSVMFIENDPERTIRVDQLAPGKRHRVVGVRLDGTTFPAEATVGLGRSENNVPITVVFLRDITEQVAREHSLAQARNEAMAADEAKARFLAVMSHEMRTPLSGVLSAVDLLARTTKLDATQDHLVDVIRTCGQATLEQVNNVLLLSRISNAEAGEQPVTTVNVPRFLTELAQQFVAGATRVGTTLDLIGMDSEPILVSVPMPLLRRAVANLLSNAVKFTSNGIISIELSRFEAAKPDHVGLRIDVSDTGIGIDPKDIDRIFRNFETLDVSYARVREGSGLGLGIAKLSIEELGGRIETKSALGEGSTFSLIFEAPLAAADAQESHGEQDEQMPDAPLAQMALLLADDNQVNRTLLGRQIETLGARVSMASDGAEAVELANKTRFDLILMDISMPRMDGLQATQMIRTGGASQDVPIVALTAQAATNRVTEYLDAGMNDVLLKPTRIDHLVAVVLSHTKAKPAPELHVEEDPDEGEAVESTLFNTLIDDLGPEFMAKMVENFASDTGVALRQAKVASRDGDLEQVRRLAHSCSGASAVIGLEHLAAVLRNLEQAAAAGRLGETDALLADAEALYAAGLSALHAQLAAA